MPNYRSSSKNSGQSQAANQTADARLSIEKKPLSSGAARKSLSLDERKERDAKVDEAMRLRMTVTQIWKYSQAWENPFYDESSVSRRMKALGLRERVKKDFRQSPHDRDTIECFIKIAIDLRRAGHFISWASKEHKVGKSRCDIAFEVDGRLMFYLERQRSALSFKGWEDKLRKYADHRKDAKPYRVLVVFQNPAQLRLIFGFATSVPRELFYFGWHDDLMQRDTAGLFWVSNKLEGGSPKVVKLVE